MSDGVTVHTHGSHMPSSSRKNAYRESPYAFKHGVLTEAPENTDDIFFARLRVGDSRYAFFPLPLVGFFAGHHFVH